jgi:hypothetical protein
MGFRFQRRIRIAPGLRLNLSNRSASLSVGGRGAWTTFRPGHKIRSTVGIPGSGFSYTQGGRVQHATNAAQSRGPASDGSAARGWLFVALLLGIAALVVRYAFS